VENIGRSFSLLYRQESRFHLTEEENNSDPAVIHPSIGERKILPADDDRVSRFLIERMP
jgi:hypothetical protein